LGARYYWPEIGRFIQQDPIGDGINWYAYVGNNPLVWIDPEGLLRFRDVRDWYTGGMGGTSDWVDRNLLVGQTRRFGRTAGCYDAGQASGWDVAREGAKWGALVGAESYGAAKIAGSVGYHRLSPHVLRQTGVSRKAAGKLHQSGKKILHVNIGKKGHIIVNRKNWYKPWRWYARGK